MVINKHKFLMLILCACCAGTVLPANADDVTDIMRDSSRLSRLNNGDNSAEIFEDVEYLHDLLGRINWGNSTDEKRRDLFMQLTTAVQEIESYERSKIDVMQDELESAKQREQSEANKILGGASIAAMGLAGMELASALSEQQAMDRAEADMRAYLATFTCRFTDGKLVAGGDVNVELPGANDLMQLVMEYKELAASLKLRKEALNMPHGIESELVLDKAESGLYDDVSIGKTDGVYTSVAQALADESSDDAQQWNQDKEQLSKSIKDSTTVLAVTAMASIAANLTINAVMSKADKTRQDVRAILDEIIANCNMAIEQSGQHVDLLTGYEDLGSLEGHPICN